MPWLDYTHYISHIHRPENRCHSPRISRAKLSDFTELRRFTVDVQLKLRRAVDQFSFNDCSILQLCWVDYAHLQHEYITHAQSPIILWSCGVIFFLVYGFYWFAYAGKCDCSTNIFSNIIFSELGSCYTAHIGRFAWIGDLWTQITVRNSQVSSLKSLFIGRAGACLWHNWYRTRDYYYQMT